MEIETKAGTKIKLNWSQVKEFLQDGRRYHWKLAHEIVHGYENYAPTLESTAGYMLAMAERALRAHDLEEAVFWQSPYLMLRAILRAENDLAAFLEGAVRRDYPETHDLADGSSDEHADDCRRCLALRNHERM
jgi:hypothetical protein